jgi:hypothetical protein
LAPVVNKLVATLRSSSTGYTRNQLLAVLFADFDRPNQLDEMMLGLQQTGQIVATPVKGEIVYKIGNV